VADPPRHPCGHHNDRGDFVGIMEMEMCKESHPARLFRRGNLFTPALGMDHLFCFGLFLAVQALARIPNFRVRPVHAPARDRETNFSQPSIRHRFSDFVSNVAIPLQETVAVTPGGNEIEASQPPATRCSRIPMRPDGCGIDPEAVCRRPNCGRIATFVNPGEPGRRPRMVETKW
jgi:hypothetical protein